MNMLYSLNDLTIIPEKLTSIRTRTQCDPYYHYPIAGLPIFTAPMSCVVDENNYDEFRLRGIRTIIPRTVELNNRIALMKTTMIAVGLSEFEYLINNVDCNDSSICIDIANGHMSMIYKLCEVAKQKFNRITIMVGNIANPDTFFEIASMGVVDFVRVGIGGGFGCTTSANCGVHYPMGSLLMEINNRKNRGYNYPSIVADGGFNNFDQIIKGLAVGADFVMLGRLMAQCTESCATYDRDENGNIIVRDGKRVKLYYGMSTKKAQQEMGSENLKTSEGVHRTILEEYSLDSWIDNFKSYLTSAMSYTDSRTLRDFIGQCQVGVISPLSRQAYFK